MIDKIKKTLKHMWKLHCETEVRRNNHYTGLIPPDHFIPKTRRQTNVRNN